MPEADDLKEKWPDHFLGRKMQREKAGFKKKDRCSQRSFSGTLMQRLLFIVIYFFKFHV